MSVSELSASTQNYLRTIWGLTEWSSEPVTLTLIAQRMELKLSSVSDAIRRMSSQGLVDHAPYGAVVLTAAGRAGAVAMVRRHRLIESFLVRVLGYSWDQVHDEAENLEHAVSDFMIERIDDLLGRPTRDPHGDPIPTADGAVSIPEAQPLTWVEAGSQVVIERISDADPDMLQFFESHGLVVGANLEIGEGAPYSGALAVRVEGKTEPISLGRAGTDAVYVSSVGSNAMTSRR